jgi:kynurenine 3-monooxygenase
MKKENAIIVGGGLVGCLLAAYLSKRGYRVDVFDRNPDPRGAEAKPGRAINLTICDRGFKALDAVHAGDIVRRISVPAYGRMIHSLNSELNYQPYGNNGEAIYSVLRTDLGTVLLEFAEQQPNVEFHFNEKCVSLELEPLKVEFEETGSGRCRSWEAARVFGADGAFSAVRTLMQRLSRFNYSQEYLDQGYKELTLPASSPVAWAGKKKVLHMWPRGRYVLLGFPNTDGSFTCSLHMPFEGTPSYSSIRTPADVRAFFRAEFPDVADEIPNLEEDYFVYPPNPMLTIRCAPWTFEGKVALIGDAAHVLFPYYGQGANAGFEDCELLMNCLEKHDDNWQAAFQEYEQIRKPNMDAIADMCAEHYVELRDLVGDSQFLLRKSVERKVNQMYPEKYVPLYSMIAFSSMPYCEALRRDQVQRRIIDQLIALDDLLTKMESGEIEEFIHRLMSDAAPIGVESVAREAKSYAA